MHVRSFTLVPFVLIASACRATVIEPVPVEDPRFVAEDGSYSLELPLGWQRAEQTLTHDGWDRQAITFNAGAVLAADETRAIDASAPELLTAMQEQLEAQPGIELVECRSATFDDLPGFRLHFRKAQEGDDGAETPGERTEVVIYCAIEGARLYALSLESRSPETFERDVGVLERMVASFRRR
jgi:hypothetical protein